jgi:hypothetical protein
MAAGALWGGLAEPAGGGSATRPTEAQRDWLTGC